MAEAPHDEIDRKLTLHGLTPRHSRASVDVAMLQSFEIGQSGIEQTRRIWGLMESPEDSSDMIRMMNYSFVSFSGRSAMNYDQTLVLIEERGLSLPHFVLTKKEIFHWFGKLLKVQNITFPEQATFNKIYYLEGEDETALRRVFNPQLCTALEQHPGLTIEGRDQQLLIFRERIVLAPIEWPAFLDEALGLAKLFRK